MMRRLVSALLGILCAAAAMLSVGAGRRPDRFTVLMIFTVVAAGPAAWLTSQVLQGLDRRLRWRPSPGRLLRGVAAGLVEILSLLLLAWIVFGILALLVHPAMVLHGLAGGTGLALGCLAGSGRGCRERGDRPIAISRTGPPFFDTRGHA